MKKKFIKATDKTTSDNLDLSDKSNDYEFKIVVVGDSGSGKTSLILRYADDCYIDKYVDSIGVDFKTINHNILGKKIKNRVWDTKANNNRDYRGAHAIIVTLDLTNQESLKNTREWIKELNKYKAESAPIILIGTKCDMNHAISDEAIMNLMNEDKSISAYVATSAKNDVNIQYAFETVSRAILQQKRSHLKEGIYGDQVVDKLKIKCENYISHLNKNIHKESAKEKKDIVKELYRILDQQKMPDEKIKQFTVFFNENKKILEAHQDSVGLLFLTGILHVLSLGIYSKLTKGTFAFWKSHGDVLCNDIENDIEQEKTTQAKI